MKIHRFNHYFEMSLIQLATFNKEEEKLIKEAQRPDDVLEAEKEEEGDRTCLIDS